MLEQYCGMLSEFWNKNQYIGKRFLSLQLSLLKFSILQKILKFS